MKRAQRDDTWSTEPGYKRRKPRSGVAEKSRESEDESFLPHLQDSEDEGIQHNVQEASPNTSGNFDTEGIAVIEHNKMPQYKLVYFDSRGRGELTRLLFAQAGVEYEDVRINRDQFQQIKDDLPFGELPVLEVDGATIAQSMAIARLVAKRTGLAGKTDLEQARVDMVVDSLTDATKPFINAHMMTDEAQKAAAIKKYMDETYPQSAERLENMLCQNSGGDGFFVGDSVTMADLHFLDTCYWFPFWTEGKPFHANFPKLKALEDRVKALPRLSEWMDKRPQTKF